MRYYPILERIQDASDLQTLDREELLQLCAEIREFLIDHVSATGGHLASNLGVVELSVAIHRVFPDHAVYFDVGHQCYTHKLLTGRRGGFDRLRMMDGMSGFQRPQENAADPYVSGHASNSLSAALGRARADQLHGIRRPIVCVVGDGALTGGMIYEALNDAGSSDLPLIVIFNDNEMSIDRNVGALARRLRRIRITPRYFRLKEAVRKALRHLPGGQKAIGRISSGKARLRVAILRETLFEILGFRYLGPADGHNVQTVEDLLKEARRMNCPVVVHLKTTKGKGYLPSEQDPTLFHGVGAFDAVNGLHASQKETFSSVFGQELAALAAQDPRICAVTAAMASGTGLNAFEERFPDRFFDVGIAEEHAVTMSAGLAAGGCRPVLAIYSTFLQRGYDQLIHDTAIAHLPVVFAVDRAGLVGPDGATHQGLLDVPYLRSIPGMRLLAPASFAELRTALRQALEADGPTALHYPRGGEEGYTDDAFHAPETCLREGSDVTVAVYGILTAQALAAADQLQQNGIYAAVVKLNSLTEESYPILSGSVRHSGKLLVLEDCAAGGCLGEALCAQLTAEGIAFRSVLCNAGDRFIPEGTVPQLRKLCGLNAESVAARVCDLLGVKTAHE